MNIQKNIALALASGLLLASAASAEIMHGKVYQVTDGDVYVEMEDKTVARVPVETANFYVSGTSTPWSTLRQGQNITVDYTPVYGFQKYYYESSNAPNPNISPTVVRTYIIDASPTSTDYNLIEIDGQLYRKVD